MAKGNWHFRVSYHSDFGNEEKHPHFFEYAAGIYKNLKSYFVNTIFLNVHAKTITIFPENINAHNIITECALQCFVANEWEHEDQFSQHRITVHKDTFNNTLDKLIKFFNLLESKNSYAESENFEILFPEIYNFLESVYDIQSNISHEALYSNHKGGIVDEIYVNFKLSSIVFIVENPDSTKLFESCLKQFFDVNDDFHIRSGFVVNVDENSRDKIINLMKLLKSYTPENDFYDYHIPYIEDFFDLLSDKSVYDYNYRPLQTLFDKTNSKRGTQDRQKIVSLFNNSILKRSDRNANRSVSGNGSRNQTDILYDFLNEMAEKKQPTCDNDLLAEYLSQGDDPDQVDIKFAMTALQLAMTYFTWSTVKILLEYQASLADIFNYADPNPAINYCRHDDYRNPNRTIEIREGIQLYYSKPEYVFTQNSIEIEITSNEHEIIIVVKNKQRTITSYIKQANDLFLPINAVKKQEFEEMFTQKAFRSTTKPFDEEIKGDDKLVLLIYENNKLIGFLTYQKIYLEDEKTLSLACNYIYREPKQGLDGLMLLFSTAPEHSLQLLARMEMILKYGTMVTYACYRLAKDILHYPKYHPNPNVRPPIPIDKVVKRIYGQNMQLHGNAPTSYIFDGSEAFDEKIAPNDPGAEFFYHYLAGYANNPYQPGEPTRGVPVAYYVSEETYQQFESIFKQVLGISFYRHIHALAMHLYPFMKEFHQANISEKPLDLKDIPEYEAAILANESVKDPAFSNGRKMFWENKKEMPAQKQKPIRCKL